MGNNTGTYLMDYVWSGWHLHMFFGLAAIVGFILLTAWAWKELKGKELKKWALILVTVGVIGSVLTAGFGKAGWNSMWEGKNKMMSGKNQMTNSNMMQGGMPMMQNGQQMMSGQSTTIVK